MPVLEVVVLKNHQGYSGKSMKQFIPKLAAVFVLVFVAASLQAATPGSGINNADLLDNILKLFSNMASSWGDKMVAYGAWLFWGLAIVSMVWTYGMMALQQADIQKFLAETVRFFAMTGFFFWILKEGPHISMAIIDSLRQIASGASGLSKMVSPSGIMDIGFDIVSKAIDKSSIWSPASTIIGLLVAGIILALLALVAVNMLIMLISAWMLAYAGVFLLGFGGSQWTQDIAINYYRTVLGIGMQIFTMIILVGIGHSFIDQYYIAMGNDMALKGLFVMFAASLILYVLIKTIPPMIGGIAGGGGGMAVSGISTGGIIAGASMGAAAAAYAGSSALGALSNVAGGAQALKEAFKAAQQSLGSSGGIGSERTSGSGGLASAMGNIGRFASEMGSHLAKGASLHAGSKVSAMKESFKDRVSDTVGGKIASAINGSRGNSPSDGSQGQGKGRNTNDRFNGNSLGAGKENVKTAPSQEEVDHFVNKNK